MPLNPVPEPVEDGSDQQVGLVHAERPLDAPQVGIPGYDLLVREAGVRDIALDAVPSLVRAELVVVDGDFHVPFHLQVLVVALVVDVCLGQPSAPQPLLQPVQTSLSGLHVLGGPALRLGHDHPCPVGTADDPYIAVFQAEVEDGLFHRLAVVPWPRPDDELVAFGLQTGYVLLRQQAGIRHDDGLAEAELGGHPADELHQRVPLEDVALVDVVSDGVAARGHQQAEEYLRVAVPPVLREPALAKVVLVRGLEVERRHVVEHYLDAPPALPPRLLEADALDQALDVGLVRSLSLAVAEVVQETVYLVGTVALPQVTGKVVDGLELAPRVEQAADDQMPEHPAADGTVPYLVVKPPIDHLGADYLHLAVAQAGDQLLKPVVNALAEKGKLGVAVFLDILPASGLKTPDLPFLARCPEAAHDTVSATAFVHHLYTGATRLVDFTTHKHAAKIARDTQKRKFLKEILLEFKHL